MIRKNSWVCDFETLGATESQKLNRTYVWSWVAVRLDKPETYYGRNIEEFIAWAENASTIYFHNLKFDGSFILDYIMKHGWNYHVMGKHDSPIAHDKSFSIVRSDRNVIYKISLRYDCYRTCNIYDSLKKLPFKVKQIAESWNLPIKKGSIDYEAYRSEFHEITDDELEYVKDDALIVADVLHDMLEQGADHMTIGGDALADFKSTLTRAELNLIKPVSFEVDQFCRQAYRGGFTWVNPKIKNQDLGVGVVYDNNSMHPSQLYNQPMPVGQPQYFTGEPQPTKAMPLYIVHCKITATVKPDHIPCISENKSFVGEAIYKSEVENFDLYASNIFLDLIKRQYDIEELEYIDGYLFHQKRGLFKKYIDKWMEIKRTSKGAKRQLAKLMLNNIYGKFGTRIEQTNVEPYLENGVVKYRKLETQQTKQEYLPIAIFTTDYSKALVIDSAQAVYDRICYIDTDSLHLTGTEIPNNIRIHESDLGAWKQENTFTRARFLCPKRYIEEIDGVLQVTCGGMPDNVKEQVTWENFHSGSVFTGKLMPKTINGGTILIPSEYKLRN